MTLLLTIKNKICLCKLSFYQLKLEDIRQCDNSEIFFIKHKGSWKIIGS